MSVFVHCEGLPENNLLNLCHLSGAVWCSSLFRVGSWNTDGDWDDDGVVTSLDALMILQAAAGQIEIC